MTNAKTKYFWHVVAKNAGGNEIGPLWRFTTQAVINQFPYTQGFEDSTVFRLGWYGMYTDWTYQTAMPNNIWTGITVDWYAFRYY